MCVCHAKQTWCASVHFGTEPGKPEKGRNAKKKKSEHLWQQHALRQGVHQAHVQHAQRGVGPGQVGDVLRLQPGGWGGADRGREWVQNVATLRGSPTLDDWRRKKNAVDC